MKTIKNAVSIILCVAMLILMCAIGASAEDFVTDGFSVSVNMFEGSGGNVLIAELYDLTLSDSDDLTITMFSVGENDALTYYCGFVADEIIVEQPNEYHDCIELYLKNDMVPDRYSNGFYVLRIESGSLINKNGDTESVIDYKFSPIDHTSFEFYYINDGKIFNGFVIGNRILIEYESFEERTDKISVTVETTNLIEVKDKKTLNITNAGDARFSVKYNDFICETWTQKTYTVSGLIKEYIKEQTGAFFVHSIDEYFINIGNAFAAIVEIPGIILTLLTLCLMPTPFALIAPFVPVIVPVLVLFNIICSFFGLSFINYLIAAE